jgi:hypothetical protein
MTLGQLFALLTEGNTALTTTSEEVSDIFIVFS